MTEDVIDRLAGIAPGSRLDALRTQRPQARENADRSFRALFEPAEFGDMTGAERFAVAIFVAALHGEPEFVAFMARRWTRICARGSRPKRRGARRGVRTEISRRVR